MTFSSHQIEAIMNSVLRELKSRGVAVTAAPSQTDRAEVSLTLPEKVVTENTLIAARAAGRKISIPAGAVITPSGRDYIRRNGITMTSRLGGAKTTGSGVVIIVGNSSAASAAAHAARWTTVTAGSEFDAAAKARGELSQRVVCCGGEPSVTACLLNRDSHVRAAVITQTTDLNLLGTVMNPQVLCLDATGWSVAQWLRLLRQQSNIGSGAPADWKEIPGGAR